MKKLLIILALSTAASAQTCSPSAPCAQVSLTNPNTLPSPTVLWSCMGASCTQAALDAARAGQTTANLCPATQSVWKCTTLSQTKTPQAYNDPEPWGSLMNYSVQGTTAGGVSATAPILTFQVPLAPAQPASISGVPTMVTSGNAGPQ